MDVELECERCGGTHFWKSGIIPRKSGDAARYRCSECDKSVYIPIAAEDVEDVPPEEKFTLSDEEIAKLKQHRTFVITCAYNDADLDLTFLSSLESYCKHNDARLMVVPTRYVINRRTENKTWHPRVRPYLVENEIHIGEYIKILANLAIPATTVNPLVSLEPLSKGKTAIIAHAQLAMSTVPVAYGSHPIILHTTGTVSKSNMYGDVVRGNRAAHNHTIAAIVVEIEGDETFHLRQLVADDDGGFFDIDCYYHGDSINPHQSASALILGDEHAIHSDTEVQDATFWDNDSIVRTLNPGYLVRHDVLDCYTISHHHNKRPITRYAKYLRDEHLLEEELALTCGYLEDTTDGRTSLVVQSNHHDHLRRWLEEANIKHDIPNWKIYHELHSLLVGKLEENPYMEYDPFELWYKANGYTDMVEFIGAERYEIEGIVVSFHGDIGPNGARGTRRNMARLADQTVIGHSHSPGIEKGCWQVGTSGILNPEYVNGPSGWMHTHCAIFPNGKRQLINVIDGKWRA